MARITRKELKSDRFAEEVAHSVEYFGAHRRQIVLYGSIALAIIVVIAAISFYRSRQQTIRQQALSEAMRIDNAPVGTPAPGNPLSFPTPEAKQEASLKAFAELANKYPGTTVGNIAVYYQGAKLADQGKFAEAEKHLKQAAESADDEYASLAKLSLAQIYFASGRTTEAEKLLRGLMEKPTRFVSKEQATFSLARGLAKTNPAEAIKLVEPLRTSRAPVSQAAIQLYGELSNP